MTFLSELHVAQSKRLLEGLQGASTHAERRSASKLALICFDHEDARQHDEEHYLGAVSIVAECMRKAMFDDNGADDEERLCRLLVMLFRCSDSTAVETLEKQAASMLPLVLSLTSAMRARSSSIKCYFTAKELINRISQLLVSLRRVQNHDILLLSVVRSLRTESQSGAAKILAGLTEHHDSKAIAFRFPGVVDALVQHAEKTACVQSLRVFRNLAMDTANKAEMVRNNKLLSLLVSFSSSGNQHMKTGAIATLGHLSLETSTRPVIVKFESGVILKKISQHLASVPENSITLYALQLLSSLATVETARNFLLKKGALVKLADLATASFLPVAIEAAKLMKNFATCIVVKDPHHPSLILSLLRMSTSKCLPMLTWTVKAFVEQSQHLDCSFYMVRSTAIISALMNFCVSVHPRVEELGLETIANLTQESSNARRLIIKERVLVVLVEKLRMTDPEREEGRRQAVRAVLFLASHKSSIKRVAKQFDLIPSLSEYGTSYDEDAELKRAALHGVVVLAPCM